MNQKSREDLAREACLEVGIEYITVPSDGEFHPTKLLDSHKKGNGRIKLFSDLKGGVAFNWVTGQSRNFFINRMEVGAISEQQRAKIKAEQQRRKDELIAKQNKAALKAQSLWASAKPALQDHPYLVKKCIKVHHTRQIEWHKWVSDDSDKWKKIIIKNALLIPLFNSEGVIRNIQAIFPYTLPELSRNKDFMPKAELTGLFSWIGKPTDTVIIVEGVATGFTVHEETGWRVYIAFSATNLLAVAKNIRQHLPDVEIIFAADNDKSGTGLKKANEAAQVVNGSVCMPPIVGMDFNDYAIYLKEGTL